MITEYDAHNYVNLKPPIQHHNNYANKMFNAIYFINNLFAQT